MKPTGNTYVFSGNLPPSIVMLNPLDTMGFQYFSLISTGMRGTHAHLRKMTLICDLN